MRKRLRLSFAGRSAEMAPPLRGPVGRPEDSGDGPRQANAEHIHRVAARDVDDGGVGGGVRACGSHGSEEVGHGCAQRHQRDRGHSVVETCAASEKLREVDDQQRELSYVHETKQAHSPAMMGGGDSTAIRNFQGNDSTCKTKLRSAGSLWSQSNRVSWICSRHSSMADLELLVPAPVAVPDFHGGAGRHGRQDR